MGYHTSNAAYAYDGVVRGVLTPVAPPVRADVVHGAGRQASQDVSPQLSPLCEGVRRAHDGFRRPRPVPRHRGAGFTAASLNSAATSNNLTTAQEERVSSISRSCARVRLSTRIRASCGRGGMVAHEVA